MPSASLPYTVTVRSPLKSVAGVTVNVEPSTEAEPLSADALNDTASPSASVADNSNVKAVSSATVCAAIASTTGKSLTGVTCNVNVLEAVR